MSVARASWACVLLSCTVALRVAPQSLTNGTLTGGVRVAGGGPLADALVTVTDSRGGSQRSAMTRQDGEFTIPLLAAGTYEVLVERLGYTPKRVRGIPVIAGGTVRVPVTLGGSAGPDVVDYSGVLAGGAAGLVERLALLRNVPDPPSSALGPERWSDGLPSSFSGAYWDGVPLWPARHPLAAVAEQAIVPPLAALNSADLVLNGVDVEWSGAAGPLLSAHSRRGTGRLRLGLTADGIGNALTSSKYFDTGVEPGTSLRTTATVSGPLIRDSAEFLLGLDLQRLEQPRAPLWPANALSTALVDVALDSFNVDLSPYTRPGQSRTEATTAFGRFDWRAARNHAVSFHGLAAGVTTDLEAALLRSYDYSALIAVNSVLGPFVTQELRAAFTRSTREYDGAAVPATRLVDAGLAFGADPSLAADMRRSSVQVTDAVHIGLRRHRVKIGGGVTVASFDNTFADEAAGAFVFAGTAELSASRGVYRQTVGSPPLATFTTPELAGFVQDSWSAAPGLDLLFGVRVESERFPGDEITRNDSLATVTGLDNTRVPTSLTKVAPRVGLRWDVGERGAWVVRVAAGQYHGPVDPGVISEVITGDGGVRGRRGLGDLGGWPTAPDSAAAPVIGPRVTLLGPSFAAPRSTRLGLSLSRALGPAVLQVGATYRHTDFLPRRTDLNRLAAPAGTDQYGRPLYGTLVQQGSLLAAQANRRFTGFDRLWAVNADGFSDYWGLTVSLVRDVAPGPRLVASYTHSRTTDNWLGGRGGNAAAQLSPFPDSLSGGDWTHDRSDFDVPHRVVVGLELALPGPFTLAGLYRYESGAPFTPGFRSGVDANGDGADDNDPAFVNAAITGIPTLLDAWDCLRTQVDAFAARNSCREPGSHRLDLRLSMATFRLSGTPVYLVFDGLNLVESDVGVRDHALYLIDRTGAVTTNPTTGVTTVPLIANPAFGDVLARRSPGRALRIGLRIGGGA